VVLLGSTGSIGTQAIDVITARPGRFDVVALAAGGSQPELLASQVRALAPEVVAVPNDDAASAMLAALRSLPAPDVEETTTADGGPVPQPHVIVGPQAATDVAGWDADVVLNGMTGSIGLDPTLAALKAGTVLALANKESLVAGGPLVRAAARPGQIVPVDSEHSALAQCLLAGESGEVAALVLTASGGPFRDFSLEELSQVSVEQALAHPTWQMGPVVTINSATMVNKGLEVIEAHLLFDIPFDRIEVVVHPQSVVHSMVEFVDGSTIAQASPPDMRIPIALGLTWPQRLSDVAPACDWTKATHWDFLPLDSERFPAVALAKAAGAAGGTAPAVFNAANEEAVAAFLDSELPFHAIVRTVSTVLEAQVELGLLVSDSELTRADVAEAESWARTYTAEVLERSRDDAV